MNTRTMPLGLISATAAAAASLLLALPAHAQCGSQWLPASASPWGSPDAATAVIEFNGRLILATDRPAGGWVISAMDGRYWSWNGIGSLSGGTPLAKALATYKGELIAGGAFTSVGVLTASGIARWDGNSWRALGTGTGSSVQALAVYQGELIASGVIDIGDNEPTFIARWDGTTWRPLGGGLNIAAHALVVSNGLLIAGGDFTLAGGVPANRIAAWDGATWRPLGTGMDGPVYSLTDFNGTLVAGGQFAAAGEANAVGIARWDGAAWQAMGAGLNGPVNALAVYANDLFAGGTFVSGGLNNIARWDGSVWQPLASGVNGTVRALTVANGELVAAGDFTNVGARWGRWTADNRPSIALQPANARAYNPRSAAFEVRVAQGYSGLAYQWRRDGVPIADGPAGASAGGGSVLGATTASLSITSATSSDEGMYDCIVANACGSVASTTAHLSVECYPNCDGSTTPPILNVADFSCFMQKFAAGCDSPNPCYGNCDQGYVTPFLNVADFNCFLAKFMTGCP